MPSTAVYANAEDESSDMASLLLSLDHFSLVPGNAKILSILASALSEMGIFSTEGPMPVNSAAEIVAILLPSLSESRGSFFTLLLCFLNHPQLFVSTLFHPSVQGYLEKNPTLSSKLGLILSIVCVHFREFVLRQFDRLLEEGTSFIFILSLSIFANYFQIPHLL